LLGAISMSAAAGWTGVRPSSSSIVVLPVKASPMATAIEWAPHRDISEAKIRAG